MRFFLLGISLLAATAHQASAQTTRILVRGEVRNISGVPISGVNVFVAGTTDGALSDSAGGFAFRTDSRASYTLAARRIGFKDILITITDSVREHVRIEMEAAAVSIAPIVVEAGRYAAGNDPTAVLTPLDIVTTPGTAADINRAVQTLPGVQQVDEGTGLFVRGGDYTETRVYLNDGLLLNPAQLENPAGTFVGTLDPFLLDRIYFTSGGFGARYGNALSGILELHSRERPSTSAVTVSAGLAAVGVNASLSGPHGTAFHLVGNHNDLSPVVRLNGSPRQFSVAPRGDDATASAGWNYRTTGRLSAFATRQTSLTGAVNVSPGVTDTFTTATRESAVVGGWSDVLFGTAGHIVVSTSSNARSDDYGSFRLDSPARLTEILATTESSPIDGVILRGGYEFGWIRSGAEGSVPLSGADQAAGARKRLYSESRAGRSHAEFDEIEWRPRDNLRTTIGLRREQNQLATRRTYDPRWNAAFRPWAPLSLTAAWGYYHQTVDPLLQVMQADSTAGAMAPMRARHSVVGAQLGEDVLFARIEVYEKHYSSLAAQTRDFVTVGGGVGSARGIDVLLRDGSIAGNDIRIAYGYVRSLRADPSSGVLAPAPADVPHTLSVIATRSLGPGLTIGSSFKYASGRPFTPVTSASKPAGSRTWIPLYGAPGSERLPAFSRLDLSASWYHELSPSVQGVLYVAISNALGRPNVYVRQYTNDYSSAYDITSVFNRSIYFGSALTLGKP